MYGGRGVGMVCDLWLLPLRFRVPEGGRFPPNDVSQGAGFGAFCVEFFYIPRNRSKACLDDAVSE